MLSNLHTYYIAGSKGLLNSFFGGSRWKNSLQGSSGESSLQHASKSSTSVVNSDEIRSHKVIITC